MGSSLRRLAPPMMFALGLAAMFAAERGLWANLTLATLLAAWIWAAIFAYGDRKRQRAPQPRTFAETEAQAREQRRLTAYLNLSPAPLLMLDGDGRLNAVNRAARRLFACHDRIPDPPDGLLDAIDAAKPGRSASVMLDLNGETRAFALATGDLVVGGEGLRIAALVDIDAELRAAEASALRDLLQVLSHEIMNALTPIASLGRTAADMLAEREDAELDAARDAVETVARRAEGLERFTASYRDLARLPPPVLGRVMVRPLFEDLARMFAARWPKATLTVAVERASATLLADADQLHAALWALLQNAAEASGGAGQVTIEAESVPGGLAIMVADDGPGVAAHARDDIFRPFFTTKASGSGVGLALVRQIMHAHQGTARLIEAPRGAAFLLELPSDPTVTIRQAG